MDLNQALEKHAEWKLKFRSAINTQETMDVATISKDNCCELGKWLHSEAKTKFGSLQSYKQCVAKHALFHTEASKVAQIDDIQGALAHPALSADEIARTDAILAGH